MDKLEEIQNKNYTFFKGVNEADLATRKDIADLFEQLLNEEREGKQPTNDAPTGGLSKHDVKARLCSNCIYLREDPLYEYSGIEHRCNRLRMPILDPEKMQCIYFGNAL